MAQNPSARPSRADTDKMLHRDDDTGHRAATGGLPSTDDDALSPSMSGSSDIGSDAGSQHGRTGERSASADSDDGALESLGRAVSSPLLGTAADEAAKQDSGDDAVRRRR